MKCHARWVCNASSSFKLFLSQSDFYQTCVTPFGTNVFGPFCKLSFTEAIPYMEYMYSSKPWHADGIFSQQKLHRLRAYKGSGDFPPTGLVKVVNLDGRRNNAG